ncbi:MAG: DNA polymerase III subunit beta [Thermochromatium sp.]
MEFIANRETVLPALNQVVGVVERRQTLPILGHLLVMARDGGVTLSGTDLEVEVKTRFAADIWQEGETTIPARKLFDICRSLSEGAEIRLRLREERCVVTSGRGRFTLGTLPAADFPVMAPEDGGLALQLPAGQIKRLLDKTAFAMAQQDVRYYLNGLLLELQATALIAVATDGHRLARFITPVDLPLDDKRQAIVPNKTVMELKRQLGGGEDPVLLQLGERSLRIEIRDTTLTSKLIDGRYPDYERVIPAPSGRTALVEAEVLKRALARAAILSNEKYRGVRLGFMPGLLKLQAQNPEQEEAEEELELEYDGEPITIGFNVAYLMDVLGVVDETRVTIQFQDANSSSVWRGEGHEDETFVVMPMRL